MIFHSLTFARSQGKCCKPRTKLEVFNTSRGTLRVLMNDKIMFDCYYCINSKHCKIEENIGALYFITSSHFPTRVHSKICMIQVEVKYS